MDVTETTMENVDEGTVILLSGEPCVVTAMKKIKGGKSGKGKVNLAVDCRDSRVIEPIDATIEVVETELQRNPIINVGADDVDSHFEPSVVRVPSGSSVLWQWTGEGGAHKVIVDDGLFESDSIAEGGYTVSYEFTDPGTYPFVCESHGKRGLIVVEET